MDVDVSMSSEAEDYCKYFDLDEARFPFRGSRPQEIEVRRAHMLDLLIFDILLISGGVRHPDTLYPPRTPEDLKRLLEAISHSQFDGLKKDCLVYFLLKWHQDYREDSFVKDRVIPAQFTALSDAYWHLDTGIHIERAVSILSDARLNRDYTTKVMQALSLAEDPHSLIRSYIRTVKPLLTEPDDIDMYTIALAESNLSEAWSYQRTFSEGDDTRKRLVRKILDWCLTPKPRKTPLTHLLAFPFSGYEQSLVHDYALDPPSHLPSSSIPVIQDLVCVRLVQSGQHAAAIKLDRQFSSILRGGERGQKAAHDRRQMMDELMAAMPAAERGLLELELEQFAQGRGMIVSAGSSSDKDKNQAQGKSVDLSTSTNVSMSWEQIAPSSSASAIKTTVVPPTPPIPQRSNAPRFGGPVPAPPAVVEEMFPSISRSGPPISAGKPLSSGPPQMPKPPSGPILFGGISVQPSGSASISAANGWLAKATTTNGTNDSAIPSIFGSGKSLFDTAGSANAAPNAFYQPPAGASTSAKRPNLFASLANPRPVSAFADLSSSASGKDKAKPPKADADTSISSIKGPHDADVSMLSELSELEGDSGVQEGESISVARHLDESADMDASGEFSVSVFGRGPSARGRRTQDETVSAGRRRKSARMESEAMLPPGAFVHEDEGEKPQAREQEANVSVGGKASVSAGKGRRKSTRASAGGRGALREPSPPPAPEPEPEPEPVRRTSARTSARSRRSIKSQDLNRSIPGGLMEDDDSAQEEEEEEEEEAEDDVAPLPPPTPLRRTTRKAASSIPAPVEETLRTRTRRSTRLSTVSSVGSSSPEPLSPVKPSAASRRKSTRTAAQPPKTPSAGVKTRKRKA